MRSVARTEHKRVITQGSIWKLLLKLNDLIEQHGILWLYSSIFLVLPRLLPEIISIWFKTRGKRKYYPFLNYESLFNRSVFDIRQEFDLLSLIK